MAAVTRATYETLDKLTATIPPMLRAEGFRPDTCILATRVACLALTELGIRATPLACKLDILNPAYVEAISTPWKGQLWDGNQPLDDEHAEWLKETGAWIIQFGDPRNEDRLRPDGRRGFNAHLLCLVERKWAVDLTIEQANRPQRNIKLEPVWFNASSKFVAGKDVFVGRCNGCAVRWQVVKRREFLTAPDWTMVRRTDPLVRAAVAAVR